MAKTPKKAAAKPIVDVAKPGKTAPSANSKSVIIPNRPILTDPMFVAPIPESEPAAKAPSSAPLVSEMIEKSKKPKPAVVPLHKTIAPTVEPAPINDVKPAVASETAAQDINPKTEDEAPIDPLITEAAAKSEHDTAIEKLIESKRYFLPINAVEKRKTERFVALGVLVSLVLIIAWADIALDAGMIEIGNLQPVTHFFSN